VDRRPAREWGREPEGVVRMPPRLRCSGPFNARVLHSHAVSGSWKRKYGSMARLLGFILALVRAGRFAGQREEEVRFTAFTSSVLLPQSSLGFYAERLRDNTWLLSSSI
jgi:hypothetical protein